MSAAGIFALTIATVAALAGGLTLVFAFVPAARRALPAWSAREWRAMIALIASIAGAGMLTWLTWWLIEILTNQGDRLITELVRDRNVRDEVGTVLIVIMQVLAWAVKLLLAGVIAVLLSLGLAINRRQVRIGRQGLDISGGDGEDPPPIPVEVKNQPDKPVPTTEAPAPQPDDDSKLPPYARAG